MNNKILNLMYIVNFYFALFLLLCPKIGSAQNDPQTQKEKRLYFLPRFSWQHDFIKIDDFETSVKTHELDNAEYPDYQMKAVSPGAFSRARIGLDAVYPLSDCIEVGASAGFLWGCQRPFKQEWTYLPDPRYYGEENLDLGWTTFSPGVDVYTQLPFRMPYVNDMTFHAGVNVDFNKLVIDFDHVNMGSDYSYFDSGTLKDNSIGFSLDTGFDFQLWNSLDLGFNLGYNWVLFDHIKGDLTNQNNETYEGELAMGPSGNGDIIGIHPTDEDYFENSRPAEIDLGGLTFDLGLTYNIPLSTRPREPDGDSPDDTPPPVIYGEELEDDEGIFGVVLFGDDKTWIPSYGNSTTVTAKIYVPDPAQPGIWIPSDTAKRIIAVTFSSRSNEKGKCMNANLDSEPQDSPDLFFEKEKNPNTECTDDPVDGYYGTCTTIEPHNVFTFTVTCEDFGAFSKMEAIECEDCVPLVPLNRDRYWVGPNYPNAREADDLDERRVRVPMDGDDDSKDNQIADRFELYRSYRKPIPLATDDYDSLPEGNGISGDGYSAYEEYRGFILDNGRHIRTSWSKKTLLIDNRIHFPIGFFWTQSKLQLVQIKSEAEGGHKNRIANYNSGHANVVDQHCLVLKRETLPIGAGGMSYGLGPPKNVTKVVARYPTPILIAHELGHAVGMRHHGDTIWNVYMTIAEQFERVQIRESMGFYDLGTNVHSGPTLGGRTLPAYFTVGEKGDEASGCFNCIMRYETPPWFEVYYQGDKVYDFMPPGGAEIFCDSPAGTGPNSGNRTAGNAVRGNCKGQIIVNDKY